MSPAPTAEQTPTQEAIAREGLPDGLGREGAHAPWRGEDVVAREVHSCPWQNALIAAAAVAVFIWPGSLAKVPPIQSSMGWMLALVFAMLLFRVACGWGLWKQVQFS